MKKENYITGRKGESIASNFLMENGFSLLEKNFRTRFGEIDLIMTDKNTLVFVEVKLKRGADFGSPEEMIDKRKVHQIRITAEMFLLKNKDIKEKFGSFRIDAVCIVLDEWGEVSRINHYENIEN